MADKSSSVGLGTVLAGRYELTEEIGRGGFGMVFRARQINMDRDVAVKVLPPQYMNVADVVERFKREAKLASRLQHPNTITLHDYGQHENLLFIVMELLTGEDLADLLQREGRLKPDRVMLIARQILKSLAEAHEEGIVHRDLKPENIYLSVMGDDHDVVKVLDFGIAKFAMLDADSAFDENNRALTISGSTVGTPTYMSPEQAAGEDVDRQTDLYALGVIMYEMLNGRPPFYSREPVKIMRAHLFEPVPEFRDTKLRGTLLDRVIRKALAKEREDRFESAHQFLLALAGEPVARPVVAGVARGSLAEPSATDLDTEFEEGPDTEDLPITGDSPASMATLQFAQSVDRDKPDDAIPFEDVARSAGREKATVRSSLTESSALNDEVSPPAGFSNSTTASSILTVIDPAPSDEEDVILLTARKDRSQNDSDSFLPTAQRTAPNSSVATNTLSESVSGSEASGSDLPVDSDSTSSSTPKVHLGHLAEQPDESEEEWEWGKTIDTDAHPAVSKVRSSSSLTWILLFVGLALTAGAIAVFMLDLI